MSEHPHYFSATPDIASAPHAVRIDLPDLSFTVTTDAGVFSKERLDPGTRVLLEHMPAPVTEGDILDLGCGYGPIALTVAQLSPNATLWAVDVNERALDLVRHNAKALGLTNVRACLAHEVPADLKFASILSNPPIRIGKPALHELLRTWLPRLASDAEAYLVVQKNLGSDSLAKWLTDQGYPTTRYATHKTYRILQTTR
jgi:16S rRNA G1207 methylase RsmC